MMEPLLRVEQLTKRFPQVVANEGVSVEINKGEIHCLLGENGAGKTTLAECLYGFYKPDSGQIYFKGMPVKLSSPVDAINLGIGMVHQHFVLVPPLTVVENVVVGIQENGLILDLKKSEQRLSNICETYGIHVDLQAKIWQLSVGEQQWVEILKALYVGSELLILDEPTAVLTPQETERFFSTLKQMSREGLSILLITHKLNEVMQISDRVTVLRRGKLVATAQTSEVTKAELARMMVGREVIFSVHKSGSSRQGPVLTVKELHARGDRGQEVLQGVSFDLHRGEILGLAGISGNGQKELFEVLSGVRQADSGQVILEDEDITNRSSKYVMSRGVGHVPEDRLQEGLIPDFNLSENLILGQQRSKLYRRGMFLNFEQIRKFAMMCVSTFEIKTPSLNQPTKFLSGGNIQKIILAREFTQCPQCLLANQPTRGLDVGVIEYVHKRLLEKREEGIGILLASEDLDEIMDLSDRIAVLFKGQILGIFDEQEADIEKIGLLMAGVTDVIT
jgi:general nucleoside transport system ATP-binding protein